MVRSGMSTARRYSYSYDDYLQLEEKSPFKLEYSDGEIFAMAGGTPEHGALAMQLVRLLASALPPECRVFSSDVKVHVAATDLTAYPDLSVVCGELARADKDRNAIINPRYLVEVTSPSTEVYDRGDKSSQYKQLASLEAILLVSHRRQQVTLMRRDGSTWEHAEYRAGEQLDLAGRAPIDVSELYAVLDDFTE